MLEKTYENAIKDNGGKAYQLLGLTIRLDYYDKSSLVELKRIANDCKKDHLAMAALRSIVQAWLCMKPMDDISKKQMICDTVALDFKKQLQFSGKTKSNS